MNPQQPPPKIQLSTTTDYREHYANSVQVRVSLWDFFLLFGTIASTEEHADEIVDARLGVRVESQASSDDGRQLVSIRLLERELQASAQKRRCELAFSIAGHDDDRVAEVFAER